MRVAEGGRIFEAIAQRAVEADMRQMNEREPRKNRLPGQQPHGSQEERRECHMRAIISSGADPRLREIEEHA
jgi:hypothetical protein